MGFEGEQKTIIIAGTQAIKKNGTDEIIGINIIDEKDNKYTMWFTRGAKEGEDKNKRYPSAAAEAFKDLKLGIGSTIGIGYTEEEREYTYKDKKTGKAKTGKAKNKTIRFFSEIEKEEELIEPEKEQISIEEIPF